MPLEIGAGAALLLLVVGAIVLRINRTYVAITVEGSSMTPTLSPGDRVLIRRGRRRLQRDQIVVIREPLGPGGWRGSPPAGRDLTATGWYIKRLVALPGDPMDPRVTGHGDTVPEGHILVIGDHPHSGDSKQHGPCPTDQILGVVVRRMERKDDAEEVVPDGWQKVLLAEQQWVTLPGGERVQLPGGQWVYVPQWKRVAFRPPDEDAVLLPPTNGRVRLQDGEREPRPGQ